MAGTNQSAARKKSAAARSSRSNKSGTNRKSTSNNKKKTGTNASRTSGSRKKTTGKKVSSASKRQTKRSVQPKQKQYSAAAYDEIKLIIVLCVCILLMLSIFNLCGRFGNRLAYGLFGIFGTLTYVLPFAIFFGIAFHMVNRRSRLAHTKIFAGVLLLVLISAMIALNLLDEGNIETARDGLLVSAAAHTGGGFIGNLIAIPLYRWIGKIGSTVLLVALMFISFVLMTGRGFLTWVGRKTAAGTMLMAGRLREYAAARAQMRDEPDDESDEDWEDIDEDIPEARKAEEQMVPEPELFTADIPEEEPLEVSELITPEADMSAEQEIHFEDLYEPPLEEQPHPEPESRMQKKDEQSSKQPLHEAAFVRPEHKHVEIPAFLLKDREARAKAASEKAPAEAVEKDEKADAAIIKDSLPEETAARKQAAEVPVEKNDEAELPAEPAYEFPPIDLLEAGSGARRDSRSALKETADKLQKTFDSFGIGVTVTDASCGPTVTRYELQPDQGVKVSKIVGLADDIKLNLAVPDIRIEAPIPGKAAVGIEVPNTTKEMVRLRDLLESPEFKSSSSKLSFAAGKDIGGKVVIGNIEKMPHLLIAGATGSGKSVCINTILISILYHADPDEVKLLMIDPKVVELSVYNDLPHLLIPVVTDPKKAAGALNWAVQAMMDRYKKFAQLRTKDIKNYNRIVDSFAEPDPDHHHMPQILIVIDELADLMMVAKSEVEDAIVRLTQLARAAGIHLVIATQRPSVNVITGLIKANVPSRIAFAVSSGVDSRTILDTNGAEKLLGNGDMLFHPQGYPKPVRLQGAFVSEDEITRVTDFIKAQSKASTYDASITESIDANASVIGSGSSSGPGTASAESGVSDRDVYFEEAGRFIIEKEKASIGNLQRVYKIGFNRAARIMDQLAEAGVVGPEVGTKPRQILMTMEEFENFLNGNN